MIHQDSTSRTADLQMRRSVKRYEHNIRHRHRSVDPRIRESIHIYMCIHMCTYTYNRSIALNWDVYAMPRACSSAKILHGVPKHYKISSSAAKLQNRPYNFKHTDFISICLLPDKVLFEWSYIYASQWRDIYKIHKAAFTVIKKTPMIIMRLQHNQWFRRYVI